MGPFKILILFTSTTALDHFLTLVILSMVLQLSVDSNGINSCMTDRVKNIMHRKLRCIHGENPFLDCKTEYIAVYHIFGTGRGTQRLLYELFSTGRKSWRNIVFVLAHWLT